MNVQLDYDQTLPLHHHGDCTLLGVSDDGQVYVEEIYGDGWLAQHVFSAEGDRLMTADEASGENPDPQPLPLPADLVRPQPGWHANALNFAGPRHRGLREPERLAEMIRPISIQERLALDARYALPVAPPLLLGLAESFVLAEAPLSPPNLFVVCRRIRLAYALPAPMTDADHEQYDYDTFVLYLAHVYDRMREPAGITPDTELTLPGTSLGRPMDCLLHADRLYVADGGDETRPACVHVWQVTREPVEAPDETRWRKLYG